MEAKLKVTKSAKTPAVNSVQVRCRLHALKCYRNSESDGDEVLLKFEGKKIWPIRPFARIKSNEEFMINLDVISDGRGLIRIDLWEKDFFTDDLIGFFQFVAAGARGKYTTDLTPCNKDMPAKYTLAWEI